MKADPCDLPAHQLVAALRGGAITAVEILQAYLERIHRIEGDPPSTDADPSRLPEPNKVHAFISLSAERALEQAEAVDRKLAAGQDPGILAGIPVSIKDLFCVKGTPSTAGSRILETFVAPYSATPVERLEAEGAIILGKTNLDEFAYGSSSESSAFSPTPGNPWDLSRVPGGSSGGSTAAVAAGESALSLGTDTAGSIRQPAAFCGVVGLKPTYGRVSRYGLIAFASSLDCPGPIARNVTDAALMLGVIAGPDPRDATTADAPVPDYQAKLEDGVKGLRIGLSPDYLRFRYPDPESGEIQETPINAEIESATLQVAEELAKDGAEIVENVPMPHTNYGIPVYFVVSRVEAASNLHRYDGVKYGLRYSGEVKDLYDLYRKSRGLGFGPQPKLRILMGMYVSAEQYEMGYYQKALRVRTLIRDDFEQVFDPGGSYRLDCLLAPTTPTTAFERASLYGDSVLMQYADTLTVPANHAGIPGLSVPAGLDAEGLPIGVQFLGPDFAEAKLFQVARSYEIRTESAAWRGRRPEVLGKADGEP